MRLAFVRTLTELAERDARIILLTGDLGYTVIEPFAERFPRRFLNVGVAEQNMVGLATGLSEAGFLPFVYSIATFASMRAYEFLRNGPVLHGLPVLAMGSVAANAVEASRLLAARAIAATVGVVSTVSPVPTEDLVRLLSRFPAALTVEAHYVTGGLGSVASELVAELGLRCRIIRCGVRGEPREVIGSQSYLERAHGLSADELAANAEAALRSRV